MNAVSFGLYAPFIVTAYLLSMAVVFVLIIWIGIDYRRQKQRLHELDSSGVVRRSGRRASDNQ